MEPTAADVAAVSSAIGQPQAPAPQAAPQAPEPVAQPAPQAQPQQQPSEPTAQPAPTSQPQDPFSTLFTQPAEPQQPQPQQPTEPVTTPQPTQPTEPSQPTTTQPQEPAPQEQYQTFEQYMESITADLPAAPEAPDPSKIDPNDEAGIKTFFDDLVNTAVERASAETKRNSAIQNNERNLWEGAFQKYGTLRDNTGLRDMVHSIRMASFHKGVAMTPTQAADQLLTVLKNQYQQGVADNQVVTTIQNVQPNGGGGQPVATTQDQNQVLTSVQTGGEVALANYLDGQIKAGNL